MPRQCIGSERFADRQTIVNVTPIVRCCVGRIDAQRVDDVDHLQHVLDLRPAGRPQQDVSARAHERNRCAGFAGPDGTQDVDARRNRAVIVGRPAYEGKDAARRKGQDTPTTIDDLLRCGSSEADPMLGLLLEPQEIDMREVAQAAPLSGVGGTRLNSSLTGQPIIPDGG